MPQNPDRPKIKFKRVGIKARKPKPPKTKEQIAAKLLAKTEKRLNLTPQKLNEVIAKEHGLMTYVCRTLKIPKTTMQRYIDKHPECQEALQQARDAMGDKAERKLYDLIDQGDVRCLLFYLSTAQRHRGYALGNGYNPAEAATDARGPVFVETVNIVGIPSGTFLPKEVAGKDNMVIEN